MQFANKVKIYVGLAIMLVISKPSFACEIKSACIYRPPQCVELSPKWDNIYFVQPVVLPYSLKVVSRCEGKRRTDFHSEVLDLTRKESHQQFRTPVKLSDIDPSIRNSVTDLARTDCNDARLVLEQMYAICP